MVVQKSGLRVSGLGFRNSGDSLSGVGVMVRGLRSS